MNHQHSEECLHSEDEKQVDEPGQDSNGMKTFNNSIRWVALVGFLDDVDPEIDVLL